MRQIRCKSEGYISIKLMTSFKKVKKLTRDWQVVRHALRMAEQLEVSPEGYRVKRRDNLPETLRKPRMLTSVVAIRVPEDFGSVDQITSMFRPYGIIALVRLLRKGKDVSTEPNYVMIFITWSNHRKIGSGPSCEHLRVKEFRF